MEKTAEGKRSEEGGPSTLLKVAAYEGRQANCIICLDDQPDCADAGCGHPICKACWNGLLDVEFDKKRRSYLDLKCPANKCDRYLDHLVPTFMSPETLKKYEAYMQTIPGERATCFKDFNYNYDEHGVLRNTIDGDKFHWVNQAHYDALGDYIVEHIQHLMKTEYGMEEVWLPLGSSPSEPRSNIFISPDALQKKRLILLIQGSGAVRPGQWARALCINESIELGSILPYLALCKERDWGVIVFNPNQNTDERPLPTPEGEIDPRSHAAFVSRKKIVASNARRQKIAHNDSPPNHCIYVWDNFGQTAHAEDICIIAHSAGGPCTMALLNAREDKVLPRLRGVAFTDSVHWVSPRDSREVQKFIQQNAINWVRSEKPLDTKEPSDKNDCRCVSAGHEKHEYTSGCAIKSVFKFLDEKMAGH